MTFVHTSSKFPIMHQTCPASQEKKKIDHFTFTTMANIHPHLPPTTHHPHLTKVVHPWEKNAVNSLQYLLVKGISLGVKTLYELHK